MAQVFVSYSSKDHNIANLAVALLEERGHRCWVAPRDIVPGTEWGQAIIDGINTADVFLLVFSNNANTSPQILREVERAVNRGLPIIPFRIEVEPNYGAAAGTYSDVLTITFQVDG